MSTKVKTFLGIPWWSSGEDLVPSWLRPRSYPWLGNENLISHVVWPKKKKKFKRYSYQVMVKMLITQSRPTLCNPMDCTACQAPLSMEFSR